MIQELTQLREGTVEDFCFIDSLRKREGSALGFMPKDAYLSVLTQTRICNRDRWKYQKLWITEDNGDLTGFCYASFSDDPATIIQIVVQEDARRWHRAIMMESAVDDEARRRGLTSIKCRVAYDLESNWYWKAIGYVPIQTVCQHMAEPKRIKVSQTNYRISKGFRDASVFRTLAHLSATETAARYGTDGRSRPHPTFLAAVAALDYPVALDCRCLT